MKQLTVCDIDTIDRKALDEFFLECKNLGYENNVSDLAIRTSFVKQRLGNIWFLLSQGEVIGMAGCHRFDEYDSSSFRIQFRGCEIPGKDVKPGLSRSHFNSSTFRELIPYQLRWIEQKGYDKNNVYLTVNHGHKNYRAMSLIERQGFLTKECEMNLFNTEQTIWKFNTEHYELVRGKIKSYVV
jgi:hypothetical protein